MTTKIAVFPLWGCPKHPIPRTRKELLRSVIASFRQKTGVLTILQILPLTTAFLPQHSDHSYKVEEAKEEMGSCLVPRYTPSSAIDYRACANIDIVIYIVHTQEPYNQITKRNFLF